MFGCAQCEKVVGGLDVLLCDACNSVSCPSHISDEVTAGVKICHRGYCNSYVCGVGDCAQFAADPLSGVPDGDGSDSEGFPLCVECDDCEKWACWVRPRIKQMLITCSKFGPGYL